MFSNRRAMKVLILLAILTLPLLAHPATAQGPERQANLTEVAGGLSAGEQFSLQLDKGVTETAIDPANEPAPAPLLDGNEAASARVATSAEEDAGSDAELVSIIVELEDAPLASYDGGISGLAATSLKATNATKINAQSPESQDYLNYLVRKQDSFENDAKSVMTKAQIVHRYKAVINGVSMVVRADQVDSIASMAGVKNIYLDELVQLDTDRSPQFIGATHFWRELGGREKAGEGVVVGILDTGIWPEHPSFADPDPLGNAYPAPPKGTGGYGCGFGSEVPGDAPFACNNKLIGAYRFMDTYELFGPPLLPGEFGSARDDDGHGTHTGSTAAGNGGVKTTLLGIPRGTISGIAPRAHVIGYKVCGDSGCYASDSAAAVDQAILDGVDVINFSIGGGGDPYNSTSELAFLRAYEAGVFVAASAGNSGPGADTVAHRGPWVTTVGASTTDRHFLSEVLLTADNGDTLALVGATVTHGVNAPLPVEFAGADGQCTATMPAVTAGSLVICDRGGFARVTKSFNAMNAGAGAMILRNLVPQGLNTDNHYIPSIHLDAAEGQTLQQFMDTHTGVTATFPAGAAEHVQGDVMAAFSSRGGPGQTLGVSKPDVTAPGVQILAGNTPLGANQGPGGSGPFGELFQAIQGTSMSSPQVAGAAALIKALHPDWTPGQIKSALMTTAKTFRVYKEDGTTLADPFDYGSGRIELRKAGDPGITISDTGANFVALEHELWNANYPSIYVPNMPGVITVQRTLHSELEHTRNWRLRVHTGPNLAVEVPRRVRVEGSNHVAGGGTATFDITIDAREVPMGEVRHAVIELISGRRHNHIPITIVRGEPAITMDHQCDATSLSRKEPVNCTLTIENTAFADASINVVDELSRRLYLVEESVSGATADGNSFSFAGDLAGAAPPQRQRSH